MVDKAALGAYAGYVLEDATIPELPNHYRGKVRDNYDLPDGRRIIIASDRLSAFDRNLAAIPFKGQVLTQTARFWFEATADICPNHVIEYPDPNVLIGRKLDHPAGRDRGARLSRRHHRHLDPDPSTRPASARCTASACRTACATTRSCPRPSSRRRARPSHGGHDEPLTPAEIVGQGLLTRGAVEDGLRLCPRAVRQGQGDGAASAASSSSTRNTSSASTRTARIMIADEIHTPDSSRYWFAGELPTALRGRRAARELRQGFRPHLGRRPLRPLQGRHSRDPTGRRARDLAGLYRRLRTDHGTDLRIAGSGRAGAGAGAGEFEGVFLKLVDVSASHPYFALHDHRSHHFHELFYAVPIGRLRSVATRRSMPPLSGGIFIW